MPAPAVLPPLSIYVHLPWCVAKCPYCDFNSHVAPVALPEDRYVQCLLEDLDHDLPHVSNREIQSIFFGGGTPSLFSPRAIGNFLEGVRERLPWANKTEVTLEANPGALERGSFEGYREAGVTRISLGVQSFNDAHLKKLGRIHSSEAVITAVAELRNAGFANFNLDLMYGLPEQSIAEAQQDIARAIALEPMHLSHYQLALEPGTVFFHRPPPLPDDESIWQMQLACQSQLASAGYQQYEVSAYAREGYRCHHNLNYWEFGDYLGLGAGAHGKWTEYSSIQRIVRTVRLRQPREYLAQPNAQTRINEYRQVPPAELSFEFMLNALRLRDGFAMDLFAARTGLTDSSIAAQITNAQSRGLLVFADGKWSATAMGQRFLNDLQAIFLP